MHPRNRRTLLAVATLLVSIPQSGLAQGAPVAPRAKTGGSPNVKLLGHLPLEGYFTIGGVDIEQEVSTVASTTSSGIDSPTIRQRRIKTTVVVNDGEALALGGMIQDSRTVSRNQIPIVGDIPLVGNLFKQKDNLVGKTELIVLITPHVIRNLDEARQVTEEFRRELQINIPRGPRNLRDMRDAVRRTFN